MKHIRIIAVISAFISICGCNAASYKDELEQDLNRFCQIYAKQNWEEVQGVDSVSEMEVCVNGLAKSAVGNEQLKGIIDEMQQIAFYRQVYPEVKEKVEALYGQEWDCPALKAFYTPSIVKQQEQKSLSLTVTLNADGDFFIDGKKLPLNEGGIDTIKPYFTVNQTPVDHVHVILQEQTSEAFLQPLLKVLPLLGIHHITLETNE